MTNFCFLEGGNGGSMSVMPDLVEESVDRAHQHERERGRTGDVIQYRV